MADKIQHQGNRLLIPDQKIEIDLEKLGWDFDRNIRLSQEIPCFFLDDFPMYADILLLSDEGEALAMVLLDYDLTDEDRLRTLADICSNSAKRTYGQRPVVVFLTGGKLKAATGLLGPLTEDVKALPKPVFLEWHAVQNIQEEVLFPKILKEPELLRAFLEQKMDIDAVNRHLMSVLDEARKTGFVNYYRKLRPNPEDRRDLHKQAVLMAGFGEKNYAGFCRKQVEEILPYIAGKGCLLLSEHLREHTTPDLQDPALQWFLHVMRWSSAKANVILPCYYDPNIRLVADLVLYDGLGRPAVVIVKDSINVGIEKGFVLAEFYARSIKALSGITPYVLFWSGGVFHLKAGTLTAGFRRMKDLPPSAPLLTEIAMTNIIEHSTWKILLTHVDELRAVPDEKERLKQMMELAKENRDVVQETLSDRDKIREAFEEVLSDREILEETFWKAYQGEDRYTGSRENELKAIRIFEADKLLAADGKESGL